MKGNFCKCRATNIIDPDNLWCQVFTGDDFQKFVKFEDDINNFAKAESNGEIDPNNLRRDQVVIGFCKKQRRWIRGVIFAIISAETDSQLSFDVLYLDYQYSELLNARDIVDDVPDWIKDEPAYARKCALTGIKPIASTWVQRASTFLSNKLLCEEVNAQCVEEKQMGSETVFVVDMLMTVPNGFQSVSELLIQEGLAVPKEDFSEMVTAQFLGSEKPPANEIPSNLNNYDGGDFEKEAFLGNSGHYDKEMIEFQNSDALVGCGQGLGSDAAENINQMIDAMKKDLKFDFNSPKKQSSNSEGYDDNDARRRPGALSSSKHDRPKPGHVRESRSSPQNWRDKSLREENKNRRDWNSHRSGFKEPAAREVAPRFRKKKAPDDSQSSYSAESQSKAFYHHGAGYERYNQTNSSRSGARYASAGEHYDSRSSRYERVHSPDVAFAQSREYRNSNRAPAYPNTDRPHRRERPVHEFNDLGGDRIAKSSSANDVKQVVNRSTAATSPEPTQSRSWDKAPGSNRKTAEKRNSHEKLVQYERDDVTRGMAAYNSNLDTTASATIVGPDPGYSIWGDSIKSDERGSGAAAGAAAGATAQSRRWGDWQNDSNESYSELRCWADESKLSVAGDDVDVNDDDDVTAPAAASDDDAHISRRQRSDQRAQQSSSSRDRTPERQELSQMDVITDERQRSPSDNDVETSQEELYNAMYDRLAEVLEDHNLSEADFEQQICDLIRDEHSGADLSLCIDAAYHYARNTKKHSAVNEALYCLLKYEDFIGSFERILAELEDSYVLSLERDCRREDAVAYAEFMAHYYKDMLAWNDRHDVTARILDIVIRWSRHGGGAAARDDARSEAELLCTVVFVEMTLTLLEENNRSLLERLLKRSKQALVTGSARPEMLQLHIDILELIHKHRIQYKEDIIDDLQQRVDDLNSDLKKVKQDQKKPHRRGSSSTVECSTQTQELPKETGISSEALVSTASARDDVGCDDAAEDCFTAVHDMLADLKLKHLFPIFEENGIRDNVLELDWADLKGLLRECGVKPGQVLEVKAFLNSGKPGARSRGGSVSPDSLPSSASLLSHASPNNGVGGNGQERSRQNTLRQRGDDVSDKIVSGHSASANRQPPSLHSQTRGDETASDAVTHDVNDANTGEKRRQRNSSSGKSEPHSAANQPHETESASQSHPKSVQHSTYSRSQQGSSDRSASQRHHHDEEEFRHPDMPNISLSRGGGGGGGGGFRPVSHPRSGPATPQQPQHNYEQYNNYHHNSAAMKSSPATASPHAADSMRPFGRYRRFPGPPPPTAQAHHTAAEYYHSQHRPYAMHGYDARHAAAAPPPPPPPPQKTRQQAMLEDSITPQFVLKQLSSEERSRDHAAVKSRSGGHMMSSSHDQHSMMTFQQQQQQRPVRDGGDSGGSGGSVGDGNGVSDFANSSSHSRKPDWLLKEHREQNLREARDWPDSSRDGAMQVQPSNQMRRSPRGHNHRASGMESVADWLISSTGSTPRQPMAPAQSSQYAGRGGYDYNQMTSLADDRVPGASRHRNDTNRLLNDSGSRAAGRGFNISMTSYQPGPRHAQASSSRGSHRDPEQSKRGSDNRQDGGTTWCNPAEYPSLREAAAAAAPNRKSTPPAKPMEFASAAAAGGGGVAVQDDNADHDAPRMTSLRQLQLRSKNNIYVAPLRNQSSRVCQWCKSAQHSSDQCRDKASNYFI